MNVYEMVIIIVAISVFGGVLRARYGYGRHGRRIDRAGLYAGNDEALVAENTALRDEMRGMKDRIQVLERLATDDESDARRLDREIEKLRDRTATGKAGNGE